MMPVCKELVTTSNCTYNEREGEGEKKHRAGTGDLYRKKKTQKCIGKRPYVRCYTGLDNLWLKQR